MGRGEEGKKQYSPFETFLLRIYNRYHLIKVCNSRCNIYCARTETDVITWPKKQVEQFANSCYFVKCILQASKQAGKQTNPNQMLTFTRWTNWFSDELSNSGPHINGGKCLGLAAGMIKTSSYQPLWTSLAPWSRGHKSHAMTQISWLQTLLNCPTLGSLKEQWAVGEWAPGTHLHPPGVSCRDAYAPICGQIPKQQLLLCQTTWFMLVLGRWPNRTRTSGPQHSSSSSRGPCDGTSATLACIAALNVGMAYGEKSIQQPMGQTKPHLGHVQGEEKSATCGEPGLSFSRLPQTINGT